MDHPPELRHQARGPGRARALHDRYRPHRPRGVQPHAGTAPRCELAGLGVGDHRSPHDAAGRRHVRGRGAGASPPRAGGVDQRLGGDLPGDHHHGPGRRRIHADREAGAGEGGLLFTAHRVRRRRAGAPSRRNYGQRPRRGSQLSPAGGRTGDGDRRVRHHRRGRHRARAVPLLVRREGLREVRRAAGRQRVVGGTGARLDPRHALRHPLLAGHLHAGDHRLLPARRRHPQSQRRRARRSAT